MALPVKIASYFGVVEYRSIGVLEKAKAQNSNSISSFITPLLQQASACRKDVKRLHLGGSKPGPQGPDSLLVHRIEKEDQKQ